MEGISGVPVNLTTISFVVVVACGIYLKARFTHRISPTIPYAGEASLTSRLTTPVRYGKDPVNFLLKTREQLGDVFCVDLFVTKFVFVLGAEGVREVLRAPEERLSFWEQVLWAMGPVLQRAFNFEDWQIVSPKLVRATLLKVDRRSQSMAVCENLAKQLFEEWAQHTSVPLFGRISTLVLSCMFVLLLGEDFFKRHGEELLPHMTKFERQVQNPILRVVPKSYWKYTSAGAFLFKLVDRFDELMAQETRSILEEPEKHAGRTDYFYHLVSQVGDKYLPVYGTHMLTMTFAGRANVAVTIPWMFLHARRVPGALDLMRDDIVRSSGERKPYVEACFRETARLYTGLAILRMTTKPVTLHGHTIPERTLVACSPAASQRVDISDRNGIYKNASTWDPKRFLDDQETYQHWCQRGEFVQFGLGTHVCPGERIARMLVFDIVFKTWLTHYNAEVISGLQEGVRGIDGVGIHASWTEENLGTPSFRGEDVHVRFSRTKKSIVV